MGWSFHKSIRILPGVRVNLSRRGIGVSLGPKGLKLNIGPTGPGLHASIPGTGVRYRKRLGRGRRRR